MRHFRRRVNPLLSPTSTKLPIEAALLVLGFLRRQTLGRVLVANYRLSGIINRHRKTLNLPEIPIPPRLSTRLKSVTLLLLPVGIVFARRSTQYTHPGDIDQTIVDFVEINLASFERHFVVWTNLVLALLASVGAVKVLRMDRTIADDYMAALTGLRRDRTLKKHEGLRKVVIRASIAAFILTGFFGSAALYGTANQSFWAVHDFFMPLLLTSSGINFKLLLIVLYTMLIDF